MTHLFIVGVYRIVNILLHASDGT